VTSVNPPKTNPHDKRQLTFSKTLAPFRIVDEGFHHTVPTGRIVWAAFSRRFARLPSFRPVGTTERILSYNFIFFALLNHSAIKLRLAVWNK
jgi:hypothetical protein